MDIQITPWGTMIVVHEGVQYFMHMEDPTLEKTTIQIIRYGGNKFLRVNVNTKEFQKDEPKYIHNLIEQFEQIMSEHADNSIKPKTKIKPSNSDKGGSGSKLSVVKDS